MRCGARMPTQGNAATPRDRSAQGQSRPRSPFFPRGSRFESHGRAPNPLSAVPYFQGVARPSIGHVRGRGGCQLPPASSHAAGPGLRGFRRLVVILYFQISRTIVRLSTFIRRCESVPLAAPRLLLNGRARYGAIGTEHAAVTGFGFEHRFAVRAFVKIHARIGRHGLPCCLPAFRAGQQ